MMLIISEMRVMLMMMINDVLERNRKDDSRFSKRIRKYLCIYIISAVSFLDARVFFGSTLPERYDGRNVDVFVLETPSV